MSSLSQAIDSVQDTFQSFKNNGRDLVDGVSSWCSNLLSSVSVNVTSFFEGDVIGLNANYIPQMQQAIEDYIININKHLDKIATDTDTSKAMQGEYALAVKEYVKAATDTCYKVVSQLRYFEDKLVSVQKAYASKDENLSTALRNDASEMNGEWTEYTRKS